MRTSETPADDLTRTLKTYELIIISGGQTGVDRGALDAALDTGTACGGWCPEKRLAEDGTIEPRYPLQELAGAGYTARTRMNVVDSDGTLVITFGTATGGTARTLEFCRKLGKPSLIIDAALTPVGDAAREAAAFIREQRIRRLNVAGPRASREERGYAYAFGTVTRLISEYAQTRGYIT